MVRTGSGGGGWLGVSVELAEVSTKNGWEGRQPQRTGWCGKTNDGVSIRGIDVTMRRGRFEGKRECEAIGLEGEFRHAA